MLLASSASQLLLITCLASPVVAFHTDCHCFSCLLLQSPLASLIPQAPAAHSFRIKTQSSAGLLSLSAVGGKTSPRLSQEICFTGIQVSTLHLRTETLLPARAAVFTRVWERAAWLGGLPAHCRQGSSCSLPRFPGRRAFLTGCCSLSMWIAPGTVLRTVQILSDSPVRERGCSLVKVGAVTMKSGPAAFFSWGITALLRCNLLTIGFNHFKCTIQWFLGYS